MVDLPSTNNWRGSKKKRMLFFFSIYCFSLFMNMQRMLMKY
jgi:hypothetical protein